MWLLIEGSLASGGTKIIRAARVLAGKASRGNFDGHATDRVEGFGGRGRGHR